MTLPANSDYHGKVTTYVIVAAFVAASGGLVFGYELGISGGITSMDNFLSLFFPVVLFNKHQKGYGENHYCKYNNQVLVLFTSSLYLAAMIASFVASHVTKVYGRRLSIFVAGLSFLIGTILATCAKQFSVLIIGRLFLGFGSGFSGQAIPLYLSEIAPHKLRGAMNILFQLAVTIGIFVANLINCWTETIHPWGWRLSQGLAGVPSLIVLVGCIFLEDTPNSLVNRGYKEEGRRLLQRIRGTSEVDAEYDGIIKATEQAKMATSVFKSITDRKIFPSIVMSIAFPACMQLTGISVITFYAPVLFSTIGFKDNAALYSAVIVGFVGIFANLISMATVDKYGRKMLLFVGGIQMFICQIIIGSILGFKFSGDATLSKGLGALLVVVICFYVLAFAWSWGPIGWLLPSEVFPLESRSVGQSISVAVNMIFTFTVAQAFLEMLCGFKFGVFLFFGCWIVVMSIFVYAMVPETRNVPIEKIQDIWKEHWFWKRYVVGDDQIDHPTDKV